VARIGKDEAKYEFTGVTTIAEAIEALEEARDKFGPLASVRVTGSLKGFDMSKGGYLAAFYIEPTNRETRRSGD
jgi:hypothetical protein